MRYAGERIDLALSVGRYLHSTRTRARTHRRGSYVHFFHAHDTYVHAFFPPGPPMIAGGSSISRNYRRGNGVPPRAYVVGEDDAAKIAQAATAQLCGRTRCHGHGHCGTVPRRRVPLAFSLRAFSLSLSPSRLYPPYIYLSTVCCARPSSSARSSRATDPLVVCLYAYACACIRECVYTRTKRKREREGKRLETRVIAAITGIKRRGRGGACSSADAAYGLYSNER